MMTEIDRRLQEGGPSVAGAGLCEAVARLGRVFNWHAARQWLCIDASER